MNVQLDWRVADDNGGWELVAQVGTRTRLRLPGWVWRMAAVVVVLFVAGTAIALQYRYRRALQQVTVQIQDVVDLEGRALAQGDVARYLAQQDASLPDWVAAQADRIGRECPEANATVPIPATALSTGVCPLAAPVQVARVEMREDVAWVEVVQRQTALHQARFYRQTPQGWLHTAPCAVFWRDPVELASGRVRVRAHQRDLPVIDPQVAHIVDVVDDVCAILDCPADVGLEVNFIYHAAPPRLSVSVLTLASPWLTGISVDGSRDEEYARALTYWVVYGLASQMVRYDEGLWSYPPFLRTRRVRRCCTPAPSCTAAAAGTARARCGIRVARRGP